jgi:nucleoside triphosphate diphosphatase
VRRETVVEDLGRLYDLTRRLRRECPWDRKQTQEDIVAYTLEETYELVDTVRHRATRGDSEVCGELGDLLFQVYFLASVAEDDGLYDLGDVASGIHAKLVRRHPHIFGDVSADTPDEVRKTWDAIKRESEGREGIFHDVPEAFPSTLLAQKLQQRAAAVGFDWDRADDVLVKVREETAEIERELEDTRRSPDEEAGNAARSDESAAPGGVGPDHRVGDRVSEAREVVGGDRGRVAAEVGDLLFSVVNLARKLKVDPELALRGSALRFRSRVEAAARAAGAEGLTFEDLSLEQQENFYQRAKTEHQPGGALE